MQAIVCESFFGRATVKNQFEQQVVDWFDKLSEAIYAYDNRSVAQKTVAATKLLCELYANESVPKSDEMVSLLEKTIRHSMVVVKKLVEEKKDKRARSDKDSASSGARRKKTKSS